ncbi:MAG: Type I Iterative PKS [Alyxoria varia]|nr:MAG: Type I Iterative PKS [Alyxoria varia]
MNVLVFGDQTADQYSILRKASLRKNAVITTFLEQVSVALRVEVRRLPRTRRDQIPPFLTVSDLVESYYSPNVRKIPEIESCLVTVSQLSHYIGFFEENPHGFPILPNVRAIGLCTGVLAAAAVVSARSLSELIPLAVEVVKIAFRAGTCVGVSKDALDNGSSDQDTWSTIVTNTSENTAKAALEAFETSSGIQSPNQAYISAVSAMAVTISGPPCTTKRLFEDSETLHKAHRVPISVYAPYHASHLHSEADIRKIIDTQSRNLLEQFKPIGLLHSAATGAVHPETDTANLIESLLSEILRDTVRWGRLLEETASQVASLSHTDCTVTAFGSTNITNSLVSALKAAGHTSVGLNDVSTWGEKQAEGKGRTRSDKIAIVGMSGRFPEAANADELWELLMQGLDVHKEVPSDRFDAQAHTDPSGKSKNKSHTPYGCFIKEPGLFDPRFFNMSPREAAQTDPMGRLALVTAYEALEMSGYVPNRTPSTKLNRIGTFYGQTSDDWREINAAEDVDTYFITGGVRAFAPGRINYYFKFSGPSFSIDTACSSSLAAVQLACTSLLAGDCDTACAGGMNVLTNPDIFSGLSKGQFLSKTGSCKTYDNDADGYCRGDGVGSIILKRYEDAVADKDCILGAILGSATNHSAEAVSITHPHAGAQEFLYKKILADAGADAHDISYVEMHGTGTQAGDGIEMTSVTNAFAPPHRRRRVDQPLHLGAVKANIGHGEASSGVNSLIKVLMMMQRNKIPPNVGIKGEINKTFPKDLAERNVHIPQTAVEFPRNGADKRLMFLNNFSAAGGNTAVLLEDGPIRAAPQAQDPRSHQIITMTARAISSLKKNIYNLVDYVSDNPTTSLSSLAYTTTARRLQHNYRVAFVVSQASQTKDALLSQIKDTYSPVPMVSTTTAFVFTGQGSQYTGLGQILYQTLKSFRDDVDSLDKIACIQGLPSFLPLLWGVEVTSLSPIVVQLGMSCIQVALARMWTSWGLKPLAVIGHSLGEYAALHVAGVLSASDMIRLVGRRAALLVEKCTEYSHGMLAVKGGVETIARTLGSKMTEVACKNGPEETVLCGSMEMVSSANETLVAQGFKSTMLKVPFAFHSAQVEPILEPFKDVARTVTFNKPSIPVLSPLKGEAITKAGVINADYLVSHARETVDFWAALTSGQAERVFTEKTAWVEVGAHAVCSNMLKASLGVAPTTAASLRRGEDPWKTITTSLCALFEVGVYIDFNEYHREFNDAQQALTLPTYSFDNKTYWLDYHNNWTLTKGEAPTVPKQIEAKPEKLSKLSTTSCQQIVKEDLQKDAGTVVFQSDLAEPKLAVAVTGHLVNENPLCPSSLYADQALTVSNYLYKQLRPDAPQIGLNVCNMEVPKPMIAKVPPPPEGQHMQIEANADLNKGEATIKYRSVTPKGKPLQDHAHCLVKYEAMEGWYDNWNMLSYMVQTQIDLLRQKAVSGAADKVQRRIAYKLFKGFVDYARPFQGMEEVTFNSNDVEAVASIHFQADERDGNFVCAPYWVDSLCHLSGFILNGTDFVDSDEFLYISHGWGTMRFARPFSATKKYTSYVRMLPQPNNVRAGDVYIFDGSELVGVVGGLKFQQIPRRIMNAMLPPPKGSAKASAAPPAAAKAPPKAAAAAPAKSAIKAPAAPKPVKAAPKPASTGGMVPKVMKVIAEETDVDMAELVDEAAFDNLGVDSLLSLTILAKLREELDMDIPASLFTDNETVGDLKKFFFKQGGGSSGSASSPIDESETDSSDESVMHTPGNDADASTPPSSAPSVSDVDEKPSVEGKVARSSGSYGSGEVSMARQIIAEEMGIDVVEVTDNADLGDMGMDSLMSLTVLSSLRESTGVDLPSTFLTTNTTLEQIEEALDMRPKLKPKAAQLKAPAVPPKPTITTSQVKPTDEPQLSQVNQKLSVPPSSAPTTTNAPLKDTTGYPKATSVLLQGSAKAATTKLFLFPDGSGSATSYINIPHLGPSIALYAMNCPFMKCPQDFTIGIPGVASLYLAEMKRRQPTGPYHIGGWSAGGVLAYEIACQLHAQGEKVSKMILLDSPCPVALEPLPARLHHFFDQIGLLGSGGTGSSPDWLLPHFESSIRALDEYEPAPMPADAAPSTLAIWAREGVCGKPGDPRPPPNEEGKEDPKPMRWLLNNRTDFGDNGWAQLLGEGKMEFDTVMGNHFTMTEAEHAATLGRLIRQGLEK